MTIKKRKTLGSSALPSHYELLFEADPSKPKFKCIERIDLIIAKPLGKLTFNSKLIKITKASISQKGIQYPAKFSYNEKDETVTLSIKEKIQGSASINLEFNGIVDDSMYGLYRSRYDNKGKTEYILTTQFEPLDARKAFVCIDEPDFKATYGISFLISKDLTALSNMPESSSSIKSGKRLIKFQKTPKMSTYLVYLAVGKFDILAKKVKGRTYRVITVPGKKDYAYLAMDFTQKFMNYLEGYFKIRYPLPKLDMIAIPDFAAGAMENWGAITGRETQVIAKEGVTSVSVKRSVAVTIAHELAHQWFGDLVTMEWWDDLWLNESFATFLETKAVDKVYPSWKMQIDDKVSSMSNALFSDQLRSTHPINVSVYDPQEIESIFDRISYDKGCCVLEMLEDYIGEAAFAKGVHNYLKKHSYSNAIKDDLWNQLKGSKGPSAQLPRVARFWINEPGYPIVFVEGPKNGVVKLTQRQFTLSQSKQSSKLWPIPIHYMTDKGRKGFILLTSRSASIKVGDAKFIKLNPNEKGFYRASYEKNNLAELGSAIAKKRLSPIDSWAVERDLVTLARTRKIRVVDLLDFIEKYCMQSEYPLNSSVVSQLDSLSLLFSKNTKISTRAKRMSMKLCGRIIKSVGWDRKVDEDNVTTMLRSMAIRSLGFNGDRTTTERAKALFKEKIISGKEIETNLKGAVYRINAYHGDLGTFESFIKMYKSTKNPEDIGKILSSIGSFKNPSVLRKALDFSIGKDVRLQNKHYTQSSAGSSQESKTVILNWTLSNWKQLKILYKDSGKSIADFIDILSILDNGEDMKKVKEFFARKENFVKVGKRNLDNALELIDSNIKFLEHNK